uniref:Guanine nucleotide-binding protein subunit gamma n=1 Tax=Castor canadensis TaxID=51338 RepID=A0A8C0W7V7_CASCN
MSGSAGATTGKKVVQQLGWRPGSTSRGHPSNCRLETMLSAECQHDPLLTGVPLSTNPFRSQKVCSSV